jgi:hypothetical protein
MRASKFMPWCSDLQRDIFLVGIRLKFDWFWNPPYILTCPVCPIVINFIIIKIHDEEQNVQKETRITGNYIFLTFSDLY